jgi:hypothetical protein
VDAGLVERRLTSHRLLDPLSCVQYHYAIDIQEQDFQLNPEVQVLLSDVH